MRACAGCSPRDASASEEGGFTENALEKPADILRFKAAFRKGREVATVNRAWRTLRAAINRGRFQDAPYLMTTPFHRFGATIKVKEETKRDRRIGLQEEQALLAACSETSGARARVRGADMRDRIIGALETRCRRGEMLRNENRHIDWERQQVAIPGRHAKDAENRRNITDEDLRKAMSGVWECCRQLRAVSQ
jgi:integrase